MKRIILSIIVAGIGGLCFCASPAQAEPITIAIEAKVDSVEDRDGYLGGKIKPGDIITGTYTYDSSTPDSSPSDPIQGNYWHYAPPAGISLTVGGFDFRTDPSSVEFCILIRNNNMSGYDIYGIDSRNNVPLSNGTLVGYILWQLNDPTAGALASDGLPTTPPSLEQWQANVFRLGADRAYLVDAHVTSAIPEPATVMLLTLGGLLLRFRTKR